MYTYRVGERERESRVIHRPVSNHSVFGVNTELVSHWSLPRGHVTYRHPQYVHRCPVSSTLLVCITDINGN